MTSRVIPAQHVDLWKCARREVQFCQELWPHGFMSAAVRVGLFVRDNDIRIIPKHHQRIFDGLKRLHPRED